MDCCALCGHPLKYRERVRWNLESHTIVNGSTQLLLTPTESRVFNAIWQASARTGTVPFLDLVEHVYSDRPDGGPLSADKSVAVHVHHLRRKLARVGVAIVNVRGAGYGIRTGRAAR